MLFHTVMVDDEFKNGFLKNIFFLRVKEFFFFFNWLEAGYKYVGWFESHHPLSTLSSSTNLKQWKLPRFKPVSSFHSSPPPLPGDFFFFNPLSYFTDQFQFSFYTITIFRICDLSIAFVHMQMIRSFSSFYEYS